MDYKFLDEDMQCNCKGQAILGGILTFMLITLIDCCYTNRLSNRVHELEHENKSLKNIILTSVDKVLIRLIKNGNNSEESDEE